MSSVDHLSSFSLSALLNTAHARVENALRDMDEQRILTRLWHHDHTIWQPEPTEINNRWGWLQVETLSLFKYFYNQIAAVLNPRDVGRRFVAITDLESPLADSATEHPFREVFQADPNVGGAILSCPTSAWCPPRWLGSISLVFRWCTCI